METLTREPSNTPLSLNGLNSEEKSTLSSPAEMLSVFGDSTCGEPLFSQQVTLDFTPDDEIDNDYVQNKCCEFWAFIKNSPKIHDLMVLPEKTDAPQIIESSKSSETIVCGVDDNTSEYGIGKTALSVLEFVEDKGLEHIFETQIRASQCSLGSPDYMGAEDPIRHMKIPATGLCYICHPELEGLPLPTGICPCGCAKLTPKQAMHYEMKEWDREHPKSMEPPGHPPSVQYCILQKRLEPSDK